MYTSINSLLFRVCVNVPNAIADRQPGKRSPLDTSLFFSLHREEKEGKKAAAVSRKKEMN